VTIVNEVDSERATPFESISELKAAHAQLLGALDDELVSDGSPDAETAAVVRHEAGARQFIERCAATGVFVENVSDRTAATVLLEYWISTLSRAGVPVLPARLARFDAEQLPGLEETPCPFKGLDAFRLEDREFFFGRDADTKELIDQATRFPLVIVSGPSGSGKSSLVMSGLLPALAASNTYTILPVIRPGDAVLEHLARAAQHGREHAETGALLREEPFRLAAWLGGDNARPAVLTIDQFEEIFTLTKDDDRDALVSSLAGLLGAGRDHRVVLTIRQEFQSRVVELKALLPFLDKAWFTMRPMGYDQLRAAIDGPARRANLQFQPGIADDLAKKVLGQSAALPLLQFTLRGLWEKRDRNRITQEVYRRVGDPLTALKTSADQFYDGVASETQEEIKRVLVQLVRVDDFLEAYRQPVPLAQLLGAGKANTREVVELLRQNDYLAFSSGEGDNTIVEVKHESLIRNWPRYVQWIDEKRLSRRRRLTVTEAADRWARSGKKPELLFTGWQLDDAKAYADLSEKENEFVLASDEAADQSRRKDEERIRKKTRRRIRQLTAATVFVLGVAVALFLLWRRSSVQGETASLLAELNGARFLAESDPTAGVAAIALSLEDHASVAENGDLLPVILRSMFNVPDLPLTQATFGHSQVVAGLLLAKSAGIVTRGQSDLQFWSIDGTRRGRFPAQGDSGETVGRQTEIVLAAVDASGAGVVTVWADGSVRRFDASGNMVKLVPSAGEKVRAAAFSAQADRLFEVPDSGGSVRVRTVDGEEVRRLKTDAGAISKIVASIDGRQAATVQNGRITVWDVSSGRSRPFPPGEVATNPTLFFTDVSFSPDGQSILAHRNDGLVQLWNPGSGRAATTRFPQAVRSACFSPNGPLIASVSIDGALQRWQSDGLRIGDSAATAAETLTCSATTDLVATTSSDRTVSVWDRNGRRAGWLRGHQDIVGSVAFDSTGQFVLTVSADGSARLWNLASRLGASLGGHGSDVTTIAFSSDGKRLVTASERSARVWTDDFALETELTKHEETDAGKHDVMVLDAQFSHDGKQLVTAYADRTARIWTIADGSSVDLVGHSDWVSRASFSPDGRQVLTISPDRSTRVWNLKGELLAQLVADTKPREGGDEQLWFRSAVFSPNGREILTTDAEKVQVWNTSGQPIASLNFPANDARFSRDGQLIVASGFEGVRLWNRGVRAQGAAAATIAAPNTVVAGFSTGGLRVFTATPGGSIAHWDVAGNQVAGFNAGPTSTAELSEDGRLIVTLGTDKRVRLWDSSGRQFATIAGESKSVTLSPDGRFMALIPVASETARVWPIAVAALERRLAALKAPCLNLLQLREVMLDEAEAQMHAQRCEAGSTGGER
jgi:WD40 repeat protein